MKIWLFRKHFLSGCIASEYQEIPETDREALEMWEEFDGGKTIPRKKVTAKFWRDLIVEIRNGDGWKRKESFWGKYAAPLCVADPVRLKQRSDENTIRNAPPGLIRYLHFDY